MNRNYARQHQYDVYCHHLLCVAIKQSAQLTARGFHCFTFSETYGRFTVYYVAHKKLNQPTRSERGANLGRTA